MTAKTILIADDDAGIRTILNQALTRQGYEVKTTGTASTLWRWVSNGEGDLVITDVVMPDENGLDLMPRLLKLRPDLPIIVMSAQNTLITAVRAAERGAYEYLPKPFDLNEVIGAVRKGLDRPRAKAEAVAAQSDEEKLPLIGRSPAMQEIYRILARLMMTDLTVMISGESGTGKELVARALHDFGKRRNGPFVAVNMAAIPRELIESELFGHEKGAFTGAAMRSVGRFEQAQSGTLFLDEIGDMPLEAQTRLLRVLQEGEFTPVGSRATIQADVRIIAATHQNLRNLVNQGLFREDLFYRLNVVPMRLPPLRERLEDIPDLVRHFLAQAAAEGLTAKSITQDALARMRTHDWPGNVRELENLVRRLVALYSEDVIDVDTVSVELSGERSNTSQPPAVSENLSSAVEYHLEQYFAAHEGQLPPPGVYHRIVQEVEKPLISACLAATRGNQVKAAELLGLNRNTLRKKLKELKISAIRQ